MAPTTPRADGFTGFRPEALQFLADLAANNERSWFQPRKADYERLVKAPFEALCVALAERFDELRLPLDADPVRSPFRIYRDLRFSRDKTPYKTHQGTDPGVSERPVSQRPRAAARPPARRPRAGPRARGRCAG